jgi:hypothetical protein
MKTGLENRFSDSSDPALWRQAPDGLLVPDVARRHNGGVMVAVRGMPWGIALFLAYAFVILAGVGLSLGSVVDQALQVPITLLGVVVMALLAYTIFTITLVLQRKSAARGLALGLTTLAVPAVPLALLAGQVVLAVFVSSLGLLLYRGLRTPAASSWLDQP